MYLRFIYKGPIVPPPLSIYCYTPARTGTFRAVSGGKMMCISRPAIGFHHSFLSLFLSFLTFSFGSWWCQDYAMSAMTRDDSRRWGTHTCAWHEYLKKKYINARRRRSLLLPPLWPPFVFNSTKFLLFPFKLEYPGFQWRWGRAFSLY